MGSLPFKQVDVFTQLPFFGNPVAVVLGAEELSIADMQRIAAWTNLSETTFVQLPSSADADYRLRIFTPKQELPFAGHPTIGSAHAVLESGIAEARHGRLRQQCLAGIIELAIEKTAGGRRIFFHVPRAKISVLSESHAGRLTAALGIAGGVLSQPLRVDVGVVWLVADLGQSETVASLKPKLDQVQVLSGETEAAGVTVFGREHDGVTRLHVRSFAPILGVAEDPVCGSGNASVAAYLVHSGLIREIGLDYLARQGMAVGRAGEIAVRIAGNEIRIGGFAVTCVDGRLRIR
jgi:PhzF family phenazine biosynthesis protein